jgi:hypothetical protein
MSEISTDANRDHPPLQHLAATILVKVDRPAIARRNPPPKQSHAASVSTWLRAPAAATS